MIKFAFPTLTCSRSPVRKTERNTTQSDRRGEVKKKIGLDWVAYASLVFHPAATIALHLSN